MPVKYIFLEMQETITEALAIQIKFKPELQISGGIEYNSKKKFFFNENICCDPSLELSRQTVTDDGLQHMFFWRNMENYL